MPQATISSGISIEYETMGNPSHPTLLWIMGFGAQLTAWPKEFMQMFVDSGFHVVLFDNRDCGLSHKHHGVVVETDKVTMQAMMGEEVTVPVPYTLHDMADDALGVLDHLGIEKAHVLGASMGGMIAQTFALRHAHRMHSLTSIMSVPGDLAYGTPTDEALAALLAPPPPSREAYIDSAKNWAVWCSKKYFDIDEARERAAREFDRSFYPEGTQRQLAAIYASGDRSEGLRQLTVPTLVIHGRDDTLLTPSGGERTAELIPGSTFLYVADMGHDLPTPLWPLFLDAISSHARRAHRS
jgi:pimeloyl-ACP methyl ester carboxylesterase